MAVLNSALLNPGDLEFHVGVDKSLAQLRACLSNLIELSLQVSSILGDLELFELGESLILISHCYLLLQSLDLASLSLTL